MNVLDLLKHGKQGEAEAFVGKYLTLFEDNQRIVFLEAALKRSRFDVRASTPVFKKVIALNQSNLLGRFSRHILYLDYRKDTDKHFKAMKEIVEGNPDDIMLRWMLAVQCRSYNKNHEGIKHYKIILQNWNPGPSLVQQTFANLLDAAFHFEESLIHRRIAVKLEPKAWSYQGLGNTLASMGEFDEALLAYEKSVELSPSGSKYWSSWAWGLIKVNKIDEAIPKLERAISLDGRNADALELYGWILAKQGKPLQALEKYQAAYYIKPLNSSLKDKISKLEAKGAE